MKSGKMSMLLLPHDLQFFHAASSEINSSICCLSSSTRKLVNTLIILVQGSSWEGNCDWEISFSVAEL